MPLDIVIGAQWGDEGKGRVVDLFSQESDLVARYNGGDNAGHTVQVGQQTYKLHVIPSGIIHPETVGVLGSGMVLNPQTLVEEMTLLRAAGIEINPERLWISDAVQLITPAHRLLDQAQDAALGKGQIGTTGRGIGPAYVDKAARRGLRAGEILEPEYFAGRVRTHFEEVNRLLTGWYHYENLDVDAQVTAYLGFAEEIRPYIRRIGPLVQIALRAGKTVLAEGAQGTLLDVEQGSYPFVTSSHTTSSGVFSGLGLGVQPVRRVIGVTKAFQTRVGAGPMPTELDGEAAKVLRGTGANPWDEFGTTTGRPRRVGWLDLMLLKYAHEVNGFSELFLTKLDVLSGLEEIPVCVAYTRDGQTLHALDFSGDARLLSRCTPVYETLPGWSEELRACRRWEDLPSAAQDYVRFIEEHTGLPVTSISVGPERSALITRSSQ
ncbi:MAG TPA: adenylosuccinate synthase [Anaerolineaceae bacterium]|nr:adenylosuccinate synthase [Anaerolineaceae bacterium]